MPKSEVNYPRLCEAIQGARKALEFFRTERHSAVKEFVGNHWSEEGSNKIVPINLLALYVGIIGRNLIAKNPRVLYSTFQRDNKPAVSAMQTWANREIEEMGLADKLLRLAIDALFSIGIAKVALATPANSSNVAWALQAGSPFVELVDLDDFVFDVHARTFDEATFIGHRYRAPLDVIKATKMYSKARLKLEAQENRDYNAEGDERIGTMGRGDWANNKEFEDMVDLWEIYLPRRQLVCTLVDDYGKPSLDDLDEPLHVQPWIGPPQGPYEILAFQVVPGNAFPKAPIQDLRDLHELVNVLYRKLGDQAQRQKEVSVVGHGSTADGKTIVDANDGDMIANDRPDAATVLNFGGPSPLNHQFTVDAINRFSWLAGNLDILGGLSPQSKTASQDRMLNENSGLTVADLQERFLTFVASVMKRLAWYWWHDPFKVIQTAHTLPGMPEFSITRQVTPQDRPVAAWETLDLRVDPYSMRHQTPQQRMAALTQVVTQVLMPLMPLAQQQGIMLDLNAFLSKMAAYMDQPDLAEIISISEPPQQESATAPPQPTMPQNTERKYVRENVPGRTRQGNDLMLMNSLAGIDAGGAPKNGQAKQPVG